MTGLLRHQCVSNRNAVGPLGMGLLKSRGLRGRKNNRATSILRWPGKERSSLPASEGPLAPPCAKSPRWNSAWHPTTHPQDEAAVQPAVCLSVINSSRESLPTPSSVRERARKARLFFSSSYASSLFPSLPPSPLKRNIPPDGY